VALPTLTQNDEVLRKRNIKRNLRSFIRRKEPNFMATQTWKQPPALEIDPAKKYKATIETTRGNIVIDLAPQHAPKTVNNFVFLARQGFYDGITFHRVINNFMVQGGDPTGTGSGGPGYKFEDETRGNPLTHETGVLSMANAGPGTNGSQFFITHAPQPHLNGKHTVFGKVVEGQDVVDAIRQGDKMDKVTIEES
jgi:peptidyl-prolyl cis-trans isomerase B (cyclophilin B)